MAGVEDGGKAGEAVAETVVAQRAEVMTAVARTAVVGPREVVAVTALAGDGAGEDGYGRGRPWQRTVMAEE